jgi:uncharacterized surface protein with fasciclin (FAS1) repeats
MSTGWLLAVGVLVMILVAVGLALPIYGAILDGRYRRSKPPPMSSSYPPNTSAARRPPNEGVDMTIKRISIIAALALALAIGVATATAGSRTTAVPQMSKLNLVQTAVSAKQFTTLAALLKKAGLAGTLASKGPFTVFAPTDAAFAKVPKATLAMLAKNKMKLRAVLLYHVVKGKITAAQAMKLHSAKTLEGKPVSIRVTNGKVIVGGATVIKANVMASNGVIHVINKVLIP